ncbi:MAG: phage tail tape measure protein [Clostridiales Family XIII bacterium]|nr:phage tail tape measure protein [Clostridia bacterium]MDY3011475.1 phage tail tape measure protein [Clostridiales Family XIII bacterium]
MAGGKRIKGITIEIDGETKGLDKALKNVNSSIGKTQAQLKDVDKLLKLDPTNTELLQQKHGMLSTSINETRQKLETLKNAEKQAEEQFKEGKISQEQYEALKREIVATEEQLKKLESTAGSSNAKLAEVSATAGKIGQSAQNAGKAIMPISAATAGIGVAAIKTTADFDSAMSKVQAISGATGSDFDALRAKAREMGSKTKFSATESAEAMSYMAMAGWKTEDMLQGLDGIMNLSAADGLDLATTSDIVTDGLTAFGLSANDSSHFADVMAASASNANTNVSMLGESFKYVGPVAGAMNYSIEDTSLALGLMANSGVKASQAGTALRTLMTNMAKPTENMEKAMDDLGISLTDSQGNMKSFKDVMLNLRKGFSGLSEDQQAQYAATIAGKEGMSGLLAIVNASDADFNKLSESIGNADGAAEKMAKVMQNNLSGQLTILKSALQELAISIGDQLMPIIKLIVSGIQGFINMLNNAPGPVKTLISVLLVLIAAAGPVLMLFGKLAFAISNITALMSTVTFASKITGAIGVIGKAVSGLFSLIMAHPVIAVITAIIAIVVVLYNKCAWFRDAVNTILTKVKEFFQGFGDKVAGIKDSVVTAFTNMVTSIKTKAGNIKDSIVDGFNKAIDFITDLPKKAYNWGKDFIQELINGIKSMVSNITSAVSDIAAKIRSFLHFTVPDEGPLVDAPKWMPDMIDLMIGGIKKSQPRLQKAIKGLAGNMQDGITIDAAFAGATAAGTQEIVLQNTVMLDGTPIYNKTERHISRRQQGAMRAKGR